MKQEQLDKIEELIAQAWVDEEFKGLLMKNTMSALAAAGIYPPEGYSFTAGIISGVNDVEIAINITMGPANKPYYYGKIICSVNKP